MAQLGDPIWPEVEYERKVIGRQVYHVPKSYNDEIEWMERQFANQPATGIKDCFITFPRGDGKAIYKVTSLRPLTVNPVMFLDRWEVEDALIRGLTKRDILNIVEQDRAWTRIFQDRKQKNREKKS